MGKRRKNVEGVDALSVVCPVPDCSAAVGQPCRVWAKPVKLTRAVAAKLDELRQLRAQAQQPFPSEAGFERWLAADLEVAREELAAAMPEIEAELARLASLQEQTAAQLGRARRGTPERAQLEREAAVLVRERSLAEETRERVQAAVQTREAAYQRVKAAPAKAYAAYIKTAEKRRAEAAAQVEELSRAVAAKVPVFADADARAAIHVFRLPEGTDGRGAAEMVSSPPMACVVCGVAGGEPCRSVGGVEEVIPVVGPFQREGAVAFHPARVTLAAKLQARTELTQFEQEIGARKAAVDRERMSLLRARAQGDFSGELEATAALRRAEEALVQVSEAREALASAAPRPGRTQTAAVSSLQSGLVAIYSTLAAELGLSPTILSGVTVGGWTDAPRIQNLRLVSADAIDRVLEHLTGESREVAEKKAALSEAVNLLPQPVMVGKARGPGLTGEALLKQQEKVAKLEAELDVLVRQAKERKARAPLTIAKDVSPQDVERMEAVREGLRRARASIERMDAIRGVGFTLWRDYLLREFAGIRAMALALSGEAAYRETMLDPRRGGLALRLAAALSSTKVTPEAWGVDPDAGSIGGSATPSVNEIDAQIIEMMRAAGETPPSKRTSPSEALPGMSVDFEGEVDPRAETRLRELYSSVASDISGLGTISREKWTVWLRTGLRLTSLEDLLCVDLQERRRRVYAWVPDDVEAWLKKHEETTTVDQLKPEDFVDPTAVVQVEYQQFYSPGVSAVLAALIPYVRERLLTDAPDAALPMIEGPIPGKPSRKDLRKYVTPVKKKLLVHPAGSRKRVVHKQPVFVPREIRTRPGWRPTERLHWRVVQSKGRSVFRLTDLEVDAHVRNAPKARWVDETLTTGGSIRTILESLRDKGGFDRLMVQAHGEAKRLWGRDKLKFVERAAQLIRVLSPGLQGVSGRDAVLAALQKLDLISNGELSSAATTLLKSVKLEPSVVTLRLWAGRVVEAMRANEPTSVLADYLWKESIPFLRFRALRDDRKLAVDYLEQLVKTTTEGYRRRDALFPVSDRPTEAYKRQIVSMRDKFASWVMVLPGQFTPASSPSRVLLGTERKTSSASSMRDLYRRMQAAGADLQVEATVLKTARARTSGYDVKRDSEGRPILETVTRYWRVLPPKVRVLVAAKRRGRDVVDPLTGAVLREGKERMSFAAATAVVDDTLQGAWSADKTRRLEQHRRLQDAADRIRTLVFPKGVSSHISLKKFVDRDEFVLTAQPAPAAQSPTYRAVRTGTKPDTTRAAEREAASAAASEQVAQSATPLVPKEPNESIYSWLFRDFADRRTPYVVDDEFEDAKDALLAEGGYPLDAPKEAAFGLFWLQWIHRMAGEFAVTVAPAVHALEVAKESLKRAKLAQESAADAKALADAEKEVRSWTATVRRRQGVVAESWQNIDMILSVRNPVASTIAPVKEALAAAGQQLFNAYVWGQKTGVARSGTGMAQLVDEREKREQIWALYTKIMARVLMDRETVSAAGKRAAREFDFGPLSAGTAVEESSEPEEKKTRVRRRARERASAERGMDETERRAMLADGFAMLKDDQRRQRQAQEYVAGFDARSRSVAVYLEALWQAYGAVYVTMRADRILAGRFHDPLRKVSEYGTTFKGAERAAVGLAFKRRRSDIFESDPAKRAAKLAAEREMEAAALEEVVGTEAVTWNEVERVLSGKAYIVTATKSKAESLAVGKILTPPAYQAARDKFGDVFKAGTGADALRKAMSATENAKLARELERHMRLAGVSVDSAEEDAAKSVRAQRLTSREKASALEDVTSLTFREASTLALSTWRLAVSRYREYQQQLLKFSPVSPRGYAFNVFGYLQADYTPTSRQIEEEEALAEARAEHVERFREASPMLVPRESEVPSEFEEPEVPEGASMGAEIDAAAAVYRASAVAAAPKQAETFERPTALEVRTSARDEAGKKTWVPDLVDWDFYRMSFPRDVRVSGLVPVVGSIRTERYKETLRGERRAYVTEFREARGAGAMPALPESHDLRKFARLLFDGFDVTTANALSHTDVDVPVDVGILGASFLILPSPAALVGRLNSLPRLAEETQQDRTELDWSTDARVAAVVSSIDAMLEGGPMTLDRVRARWRHYTAIFGTVQTERRLSVSAEMQAMYGDEGTDLRLAIPRWVRLPGAMVDVYRVIASDESGQDLTVEKLTPGGKPEVFTPRRLDEVAADLGDQYASAFQATLAALENNSYTESLASALRAEEQAFAGVLGRLSKLYPVARALSSADEDKEDFSPEVYADVDEFEEGTAPTISELVMASRVLLRPRMYSVEHVDKQVKGAGSTVRQLMNAIDFATEAREGTRRRVKAKIEGKVPASAAMEELVSALPSITGFKENDDVAELWEAWKQSAYVDQPEAQARGERRASKEEGANEEEEEEDEVQPVAVWQPLALVAAYYFSKTAVFHRKLRMIPVTVVDDAEELQTIRVNNDIEPVGSLSDEGDGDSGDTFVYEGEDFVLRKGAQVPAVAEVKPAGRGSMVGTGVYVSWPVTFEEVLEYLQKYQTFTAYRESSTGSGRRYKVTSRTWLGLAFEQATGLYGFTSLEVWRRRLESDFWLRPELLLTTGLVPVPQDADVLWPDKPDARWRVWTGTSWEQVDNEAMVEQMAAVRSADSEPGTTFVPGPGVGDAWGLRALMYWLVNATQRPLADDDGPTYCQVAPRAAREMVSTAPALEGLMRVMQVAPAHWLRELDVVLRAGSGDSEDELRENPAAARARAEEMEQAVLPKRHNALMQWAVGTAWRRQGTREDLSTRARRAFESGVELMQRRAWVNARGSLTAAGTRALLELSAEEVGQGIAGYVELVLSYKLYVKLVERVGGRVPVPSELEARAAAYVAAYLQPDMPRDDVPPDFLELPELPEELAAEWAAEQELEELEEPETRENPIGFFLSSPPQRLDVLRDPSTGEITQEEIVVYRPARRKDQPGAIFVNGKYVNARPRIYLTRKYLERVKAANLLTELQEEIWAKVAESYKTGKPMLTFHAEEVIPLGRILEMRPGQVSPNVQAKLASGVLRDPRKKAYAELAATQEVGTLHLRDGRRPSRRASAAPAESEPVGGDVPENVLVAFVEGRGASRNQAETWLRERPGFRGDMMRLFREATAQGGPAASAAPAEEAKPSAPSARPRGRASTAMEQVRGGDEPEVSEAPKPAKPVKPADELAKIVEAFHGLTKTARGSVDDEGVRERTRVLAEMGAALVGLGVPRDRVRAWVWAARPEGRGAMAAAVKRLRELGLTDEQILALPTSRPELPSLARDGVESLLGPAAKNLVDKDGKLSLPPLFLPWEDAKKTYFGKDVPATAATAATPSTPATPAPATPAKSTAPAKPKRVVRKKSEPEPEPELEDLEPREEVNYRVTALPASRPRELKALRVGSVVPADQFELLQDMYPDLEGEPVSG